jgi:hypothetical protein
MLNKNYYTRNKLYYFMIFIFIIHISYLVTIAGNLYVILVLLLLLFVLISYNIQLIILEDKSIVFISLMNISNIRLAINLIDINFFSIKKSMLGKKLHLQLQNNKIKEVNISYFKIKEINKLIKDLVKQNVVFKKEDTKNKDFLYYSTENIKFIFFFFLFLFIFSYFKSIPLDELLNYLFVGFIILLLNSFFSFYFLRMNINNILIIKPTKFFKFKRKVLVADISSISIVDYKRNWKIEFILKNDKRYKYILYDFGNLELDDFLNDLKELNIKYEVIKKQRGKKEEN